MKLPVTAKGIISVFHTVSHKLRVVKTSDYSSKLASKCFEVTVSSRVLIVKTKIFDVISPMAKSFIAEVKKFLQMVRIEKSLKIYFLSFDISVLFMEYKSKVPADIAEILTDILFIVNANHQLTGKVSRLCGNNCNTNFAMNNKKSRAIYLAT